MYHMYILYTVYYINIIYSIYAYEFMLLFMYCIKVISLKLKIY